MTGAASGSASGSARAGAAGAPSILHVAAGGLPMPSLPEKYRPLSSARASGAGGGFARSEEEGPWVLWLATLPWENLWRAGGGDGGGGCLRAAPLGGRLGLVRLLLRAAGRAGRQRLPCRPARRCAAPFRCRGRWLQPSAAPSDNDVVLVRDASLAVRLLDTISFLSANGRLALRFSASLSAPPAPPHAARLRHLRISAACGSRRGRSLASRASASCRAPAARSRVRPPARSATSGATRSPARRSAAAAEARSATHPAASRSPPAVARR